MYLYIHYDSVIYSTKQDEQQSSYKKKARHHCYKKKQNNSARKKDLFQVRRMYKAPSVSIPRKKTKDEYIMLCTYN